LKSELNIFPSNQKQLFYAMRFRQSKLAYIHSILSM